VSLSVISRKSVLNQYCAKLTDGNYSLALDYLGYAYSQTKRKEEALQVISTRNPSPQEIVEKIFGIKNSVFEDIPIDREK